MSFFGINLQLAFVWAALWGVSLASLVTGFGVGFIVLALAQRLVGSKSYVQSGLGVARLAFVFTASLVASNLRLARDILRPRPRFASALLAVDVTDLSPSQVTIVSALISLTPGSITVDVADDGSRIFVHTLYAGDPEGARKELRAMATLVKRAGSNPEQEVKP